MIVAKFLMLVFSLFTVLAFSYPVYAFNLFVTSPTTGIAIHGFDPVAYFDKNAAILGVDGNEVEWGGTYWKFENAANKERFLESPKAFVPQFNGYGAYSVAQDRLTEGNPNVWAIYENKLLFFYSLEARDKWIKKPIEYTELGENNWERLRMTLSK